MESRCIECGQDFVDGEVIECEFCADFVCEDCYMDHEEMHVEQIEADEFEAEQDALYLDEHREINGFDEEE